MSPRSVERKPVLFVGHSPNANSLPALDPSPGNTAGRRLFEMTGWSMEDWLKHVDRVNVLPVGWQSMPATTQRVYARGMLEAGAFEKRVVVFVGKSTVELFDRGLSDAKDLKWFRTPKLKSPSAWMHHTSGLSRHWNDPSNRLKFRAFMANLLDSLERAYERRED